MPVLNKIDLPSAEPDKVIKELEEMIGIDGSNSIMVSAKRGIGINELLEKIVTDLPAPDGDPNAPLRALLIDSWYDVYLGIVILIRVKDGCISLGDDITMMSNNKKYIVDRLGIFNPKMEKCQTLYSGEIGFITAAIKDIEETAIGDTITHTKNPTLSPFPGFKSSNPVVFCGIFPKDETNFSEMKKSIAKLKLNDNSFHYEVEKSTALGTGFRCGFLGLLHMDIICERLRRESNIDLVATAPSVVYKVVMKDGKVIEIYNPSDLPDPSEIQHIEEPWIKGTVITSADYLGAIITLCEEKRGEHINLTYVNNQVMLEYNLPLNEIVFDFNDSVKSLSKGFASFNYELSDYRPGKLVKVSIIVHNNIVDGLSFITHYDKAPQQGRDVCSKLKDLIQRHQFKIAIQAAIGGKIIARETIAGFRKGVTDKLYGGDRTRKMKLLEKQKEGKKRMEGLGKVNIPQSAFLAVAQVNKK
ncbi:putative translation factor GUF1 [Triplophysa rosa]|uniref:Translation factor GUF1 n=2 Tax=Triplophysa rosa TaxID=992332 RepID=A0A9W7T3L1_TRIRA|nr:putative translation factor GUF1 [Triplophysa rosa]